METIHNYTIFQVREPGHRQVKALALTTRLPSWGPGPSPLQQASSMPATPATLTVPDDALEPSHFHDTVENTRWRPEACVGPPAQWGAVNTCLLPASYMGCFT